MIDTLRWPLMVEPAGDGMVVRDDLVPGGSKRRAVHTLLDEPGISEYVYATPAYGYAQLALALAGQELPVDITLFVAQRKELHPLTAQAQDAGATIAQVPMGFLSVVQARAREYAEAHPRRHLLPFGLADDRMVQELARQAATLGDRWPQVWSCGASGTMAKALMQAFPSAEHHVVVVGHKPEGLDGARLHLAPERFEQPARKPPPFPSAPQYDAKVWQFYEPLHQPGALYWNVA
jgi:hypothetical protein